jgi:hypothetical protein
VNEEFKDITNWAAVVGLWDFSNGRRVYEAPEEPQWPYGICLSNVWFSQGTARATIRFAEVGTEVEASARLLFGWRSLEHPYFSIGLGGAGRAYCAYQYDPASGWSGVAFAGSRKNLTANYPYKLSVRVQGQRVLLEVVLFRSWSTFLKTRCYKGSSVCLHGEQLASSSQIHQYARSQGVKRPPPSSPMS